MRGAVLASVMVARVVWADPADQPSAVAAKLFEEGRALAKAGDYAGACDRFGKAHELDAGVGIELNLADCDEHLGRVVLAYHLFDHAAAAAAAAGNDAQGKLARGRADALAAKLGTVVVDLPNPTAAGLELTIDGHKETPAAEVREIVNPGTIEVSVTVPGKPPFSQSTHASAGGTAVVVVTSDKPAAVVPTPTFVSRRRRSWARAGYALGGGAVAIAATSVAIGLVARSNYQAQYANQSCTRGVGCNAAGFEQQRHARSLANVATGFGIAAAVLAAGSAVAFVAAPRDNVTVSLSGAGVAISGQF